MASSRQIQVMKLRVMEKLDDIFSQQKTLIASIDAMSSQVKKKAERVLKSASNDVTISDYVNVLEELETCFNNLIIISATTDDLCPLTNPAINPYCGNKNILAEDSLSKYKLKWSSQEMPENHPPQHATSFHPTQPNHANSLSSKFSSNVKNVSEQPIVSDMKNYSGHSWTTNQYSPEIADSVNFSSSQPASLCGTQANSVFTSELVPPPGLESIFGNANISSLLRDISKMPNIVSAAPFCPKGLSIEEPYSLGPELKCQKVISISKVQVCETINPYYFWVQLSDSVQLLQELTTEIRFFIRSCQYNLQSVYGISCPLAGMSCIAPFTDDTYYRARVISIAETEDPEHPLASKVNVLYVDYGNMDVIPTSSLIKMPKSFATLPVQAICCALAKVMPNRLDEDWPTSSSEMFHNMVYCKELVCDPVYDNDLLPQIVDLYFIGSTASPAITLQGLQAREENKISSNLIKMGFAKPITESVQIEKIYPNLRNLNLFRSNSFSDKGRVLTSAESPFTLSTQVTKQDQTNDNQRLHQQGLQACEESNCSSYQNPASPCMIQASPQGTQLDATLPESGSKSSPLDTETAGKSNLFSLSDTLSNLNLLTDSSTFDPKESVIKRNCIIDSQTAISTSENSAIPVSADTTISCSDNHTDSGLSSSAENSTSGRMSAKLSEQDTQINSETAGKSNLLLSDTLSNLNLLTDSSTFDPKESVIKRNCIADSQTAISTSENSAIPVPADTTISCSDNHTDSGLSSSAENSTSGRMSAKLSEQDTQINSSQNSQSSDSDSINSKPDIDGFNAVMIAHVESPSSFYVHRITKETGRLSKKLLQDLNKEFHYLTQHELTRLSSELIIENGQLCCVYYVDEEVYYRGLIVEHKTDALEGVLVKVFYVDFGNSDWLHCEKIYQLPQPYSEIPALAQHCALAYVKPQGHIWTEEAKAAFRNLLKVKETYFIKDIAGSSTLDLPSLENYEKAPVEVLMMNYDSGSSGNGSDPEDAEKTEICLNYELIDRKHADINSPKSTDLNEWDPMLDDFDSRRNKYDVNTDDAEIAAIGFKVKDESKICKFFRDGRKCWLGAKCHYKHIRLEKDCFTADKRETVCNVGFHGQIQLPKVGSLLGVEVSAVSSPGQFYIILPWGIELVNNLNSMPVCPSKEETLPDLQESLQKYYNKLPPRSEENLLWSIGELVVARAVTDEQWYRARILDVSDMSDRVKVFFVDYGNVEWIPEKYIQPIRSQFVHLLHQAVECCLAGIASASADGLWTQEARNYFLELVDGGVLVARVSNIISRRLYIDLYDTSKEEYDENIAELLVKVGVARKVDSQPKSSVKPTINNRDKAKSSKHAAVLIPG